MKAVANKNEPRNAFDTNLAEIKASSRNDMQAAKSNLSEI